MTTEAREYCLFPLGTVLFPGGPLPLRIFEARYLDMVSRCMREEVPFGVCLIRTGREVGVAAQPFSVGTLARIVDWSRSDDGVLGIAAEGTARFRIESTRVQDDNLLVGQCTPLGEPEIGLPGDAGDLADLLRRAFARAPDHYAKMSPRFDDASWVSYRLSEMIPLPAVRKQQLLELDDPLARLDAIREILAALQHTARRAQGEDDDPSAEEP